MTHYSRVSLRAFCLFPLAAIAIGMILTSPVFSQPQALAAGLPGAEKFYSADLASYYTNRELRPIWLRGSGSFQPRVRGALKILEDSWTHGLNPERYRIAEIKNLLENLNADNRLELDLVVSDAVIRYAHDLTGMRGEQRSADRMIQYWRKPLETTEILTMVGGAADPIAQVRDLEPANILYQSLRSELMTLVAQPVEKDFKPIVISGSLKPGKSHKAIPEIREKLGLAHKETNEEIYDEALAVEVIRLQKTYGIETDGVINARTLEVINLTNEDKIWQIVTNMERLRWISQGRPDRYILVNIPSASLWAVDGGEVKLEMPVIVGKTARPTYSFKTEITGVRFNPNWTVPPTIKSKDFLPQLRADPLALAKRGIRITQNGREIDPTSIDWNSMGSRGLSNVSMVQNPGDDNPLGKVRVIMENPYNIYLHDTNHRELFDKNERNLSSGCIRVSQPEKLADFILGKNEGWTWDGMEKMIESGRMRDVPTAEKIPVFITYQTVWLDTDGRLVYGRDVYGQDKKLADMLKKAGAIHLPQVPEKSEISL